MKKINCLHEELILIDKLLRFFEAEKSARHPVRQSGRVTEPATVGQLELLANLGIYPKWQATRQEADEMICHYKVILGSAKRRP